MGTKGSEVKMLYRVIDVDGESWVIANGFGDALSKWESRYSTEYETEVGDRKLIDFVQSVELISNGTDSEILISYRPEKVYEFSFGDNRIFVLGSDLEHSKGIVIKQIYEIEMNALDSEKAKVEFDQIRLLADSGIIL